MSRPYEAPVYPGFAADPPYAYSWNEAGWWQGRWYPAGWFAWVNGQWYLKGYGVCPGWAAPY